MRLAVLDVGSHAVNLLVGDEDGGVPLVAHSWKVRTGLVRHLAADGTIQAAGGDLVADAVDQAAAEIGRVRAGLLFAYATASVRDAPNGPEVLDKIEKRSGVRLGTLSGADEARLTFLAARRWLGGQAGPLRLLDIGGGTVEVASGRGRLPETARSLPLGAGRLTREFLSAGDPPKKAALEQLREHVRTEVKGLAAGVGDKPSGTTVAASNIFRQLARLTGEPAALRGQYGASRLRRKALRPWPDRLIRLSAAELADLPGVSRHRSPQILAGAVVGLELMSAFEVSAVRICPWGLREGILLSRIERGGPDVDGSGWTSCRPGRAAVAGGHRPTIRARRSTSASWPRGAGRR